MIEYKGFALLSGFLVKHGAVIFGLAVGTAAKFGRMMSTGQRITCRQVLGHCLMMAMVGLVATFLTDMAGITDPNARAFTASILAIAANDVLKYLATRGWQRFFQDPVEARGRQRNELQARLSAERLIHDAEDDGPIDPFGEAAKKGKRT